jgi:YidC/Oxa1 family membrane protein insertase
MFETLLIQPIFNLLVLIYALIPGHDFGLAVIVFTIVIRFLLWPLLRKQLHQSKVMRDIQPDIKKIKERTKGDRQREAELLMELYKERGVNPFSSIGVMFVQLPILIGLFQGLRRLADNKQTIIDLSYGWVKNVGWMKDVTNSLNNFDETLFGVVDLTRSAFGDAGRYWPVLLIAFLAALLQFFQSKQLMPSQKDSRKLRDILKGEASGKKAEQSEINAAMGKNMRYLFPALTFLFASSVPGALGLYWATGSLVGLIQQRSVLSTDVEEMEEIAEGKLPTGKAVKKKSGPKTRSARKKIKS